MTSDERTIAQHDSRFLGVFCTAHIHVARLFRTSFAQYAPVAQNVTRHLKMYFLLNMGDFPAGHVSLLYFTAGHIAAFLTCMVLTTWILDVKRADINFPPLAFHIRLEWLKISFPRSNEQFWCQRGARMCRKYCYYVTCSIRGRGSTVLFNPCHST